MFSGNNLTATKLSASRRAEHLARVLTQRRFAARDVCDESVDSDEIGLGDAPKNSLYKGVFGQLSCSVARV